MRTVLLVLACLAGCAAAPMDAPTTPLHDAEVPADPGDPRVVLNQTIAAARYLGYGVGPWAVNTGCDSLWDPGGPANVGGACFQLPNGTAAVDFEVTDDLTPAVGIYVRYDSGSAGFYCVSGGDAPPAGAEWIMVIIQDLACAIGQRPAAATTGQIKVTMYHP